MNTNLKVREDKMKNRCTKSFYVYFYEEFIHRDFIGGYFLFSNIGNNFINILQLCVLALGTQYSLNQVCVVSLSVFYQKLPLLL